MAQDIYCPFCRALTVYRFRLGSDWAGHPEYEKSNPDICYEEYEAPEGERPDVEVYHCRRCGRIFDALTTEPAPRAGFIPADSLRERINNLQSTLEWQTRNYKKRCATIRDRAAKRSDAELLSLERDFAELHQENQKIQGLNDQLETLEHILRKDIVIPGQTLCSRDPED